MKLLILLEIIYYLNQKQKMSYKKPLIYGVKIKKMHCINMAIFLIGIHL